MISHYDCLFRLDELSNKKLGEVTGYLDEQDDMIENTLRILGVKQMKLYRLIKDIPFAKAGEIFQQSMGVRGGKEEPIFISASHITTGVWAKDIKNFDEWFEEIKSFEIPDEFEMGFWTIMHGENGFYAWHLSSDEFEEEYEGMLKYHMERGWAFPTKEEAEKHFEWLKARAVLLEDTKGFKPDWNDERQRKYSVAYDHIDQSFEFSSMFRRNAGNIHFETEEDAENSIKNHKKEWKIYLGVEE